MKWLTERPFKRITREMAADFNPVQSALYMPADTMLCVQEAENRGMISKENTDLFLVERNRMRYERMCDTASELGWISKSTCYHGSLEESTIPFELDYAWIDLNGTITLEIAQWMANKLMPKMSVGSILCLTQEYCWRNNTWMKAAHQKTFEEYRRLYEKFRWNNVILGDKFLSYPAFLIQCIMNQWEILILDPYRYRDTIDMVLFRFMLVSKVKPTFPYLEEVAGLERPTTRSEKHMSQSNEITMREVVDSIVNASNAAYKAHATRRLNAYILQQTKKGKDPDRVRAAVKAYVTRNTVSS